VVRAFTASTAARPAVRASSAIQAAGESNSDTAAALAPGGTAR
jgi:hypothetical protein